MTTYSIGEVKVHLAEILRDLNHGEGVIITRRGRPRGRLTAVDGCADDKSSLSTLRAHSLNCSKPTTQDFCDIRETLMGKPWRPR